MWKAMFLLSADTHWEDFLEAVDGVGDSWDPVSKYNKNFERDEKIKSLKVSGIWKSLSSQETNGEICQTKEQSINGYMKLYSRNQDTENFPDMESVYRCLLEWHGGKLSKHPGFAPVCDDDKQVGEGHQNDGNRNKSSISQLWLSEHILQGHNLFFYYLRSLVPVRGRGSLCL